MNNVGDNDFHIVAEAVGSVTESGIYCPAKVVRIIWFEKKL